MYTTVTRTEQFSISDTKKDREAYDAIINNPLTTIIREIKEKLTEKAMNEDGEPTYIQERIVLVVTWQEKVLVD
jgi:DNA primase large subunit